jgi:hypothetical protein
MTSSVLASGRAYRMLFLKMDPKSKIFLKVLLQFEGQVK